MRFIACILVVPALLLVHTACPRADSNDATQIGGSQKPSVSDQKSTEVIVPPGPVVPVGAKQFWLETTDRHQVSAWYWAPMELNSPGVILLHMNGKDKSTYAEMAPKLVDEGFAALAIDFRGHGATLGPDGRPLPFDSLTDADYADMLKDIEAAHSLFMQLDDVDDDRVGIIGASIGANLGIIYAAGDRRVRTVVALSPGEDYKGLKPIEALPDYGARALYLIAGRDDTYSYNSSLEIERAAKEANPVSLRAFDGRDHGTNLLAAHPGLDMTIASGWLLNHLPPNR